MMCKNRTNNANNGASQLLNFPRVWIQSVEYLLHLKALTFSSYNITATLKLLNFSQSRHYECVVLLFFNVAYFSL